LCLTVDVGHFFCCSSIFDSASVFDCSAYLSNTVYVRFYDSFARNTFSFDQHEINRRFLPLG
jgi:hypothetical protein